MIFLLIALTIITCFLIIRSVYVYAIVPMFILEAYVTKFKALIETKFYPLSGFLHFLSAVYTKNYNDQTKLLLREPNKNNIFLKCILTNVGTIPYILLQEYSYAYLFQSALASRYTDMYILLPFSDIFLKDCGEDVLNQQIEQSILNKFFSKKNWRIQSFFEVGQAISKKLKNYSQAKKPIPLLQIIQDSVLEEFLSHEKVLGKEFSQIKCQGDSFSGNSSSIGKNIYQEIADGLRQLSQVIMYSNWTIVRRAFLGHCNYQQTPKWLLSKQEQKVINQILEIKKSVQNYFKSIRRHLVKSEDPNYCKSLMEIILEELDKVKNQQELKQLEENFLFQLIIQLVIFCEKTIRVIIMALYSMSDNPEIQEQLRKELHDQHFLNLASEISKQDVADKLKYLNALIFETDRLYPPAPITLGRKAKVDHYLNDLYIRKNSFVDINIQGIHTKHQYWQLPEKFNPGRWLDSTNEKLQQQKEIMKLTNFTQFMVTSAENAPSELDSSPYKLVQIVLAILAQQFKFKLKDEYNLQMQLTYLYEPKDDNFLKEVTLLESL